ncbi:uncharacterized protein SCHCODRAFT_02495232 [Schizophyllum commune H4-8]|uniref:uncharacterized protein n=1 Tax=Schizophyllum commune (strain H4-8 / FGSC 9210) TaxID=578458 RepID=UPI00215DD61D|nr:uncharacterized protein SCHCODRAFT_02495232 [Schizophyllum commune H4-8]KAI5894915.1 hypothetical protein SCHCODRAFT_02495232 [Schizophyllum commune H4-8]
MLSRAWRCGVQRSALLQARGRVSAQLSAYLHASTTQHNAALSQQGLDVRNLAPLPPPNGDAEPHPVRVRGAHIINRAPRRHGWKEFALVSTLDASKLQPTDVQDLSGLRFHGINIIPDPDDRANSHRKRDIYRIPFTYTRWPLTAPSLLAPFPEGTRGFFYFYHNALHPATSGVRFRVVPSGRPEDFAAGHDLLTSEGVVWGPRMYRLVFPFKPGAPRGYRLSDEELRSEYYRRDRGTPIRQSSKLRYQARQGELLDYLTDFHISEEDLKTAKMVSGNGPQNSYHSRQQFTIESLTEPFTLPLGLGRSVRMITPDGIHVLRLQTIWSIARMPVWDGSCFLWVFNNSTLMSSSHRSRPRSSRALYPFRACQHAHGRRSHPRHPRWPPPRLARRSRRRGRVTRC